VALAARNVTVSVIAAICLARNARRGITKLLGEGIDHTRDFDLAGANIWNIANPTCVGAFNWAGNN